MVTITVIPAAVSAAFGLGLDGNVSEEARAGVPIEENGTETQVASDDFESVAASHSAFRFLFRPWRLDFESGAIGSAHASSP